MRYSGNLPAQLYGESFAGKTLQGSSSLQLKRSTTQIIRYAGDSVGASKIIIFTYSGPVKKCIPFWQEVYKVVQVFIFGCFNIRKYFF